MNTTSTSKGKPRIAGRLFRFCLGVFFVTEVWPVYRDVSHEGVIIRLTWAIGLLSIYIFLHLAILKFTPSINRIVGALLAFVPLIATFYFGYGGPAATGALTFLATSLLVAAIRKDPGCEVMSIPAVFSGKHTHLACLLFSPVDWCENKFSKKN